jgi:membrane-bound serine protease (ClpP class)
MTRWLWLLGLLFLLMPGGGRGSALGPVVIIRLDDTVNTVSAEYVTRGLSYAADQQARAVVLELSTPGGLDSAMRAIIEKILASPVPVIGYVSPSGARSASAGFYILLSCDVAAMAPGTNTGAAHPVVLGGEPDKIEAAKMQSDAAAFIRSLATRRGRNVKLAEQGVVESVSFTDQEALQGGLIDLIAPNLDQLLSQLNGRAITRLNGQKQTLDLAGVARVDYTMTLREKVLDMNASLAFALLAIGALLIYLEFTHPGAVVPGVAGVILVVVALFALSLLPINWAGAGLLILALALFVLEAKFPSHGALAVGGVVCMALGGILLVDAPLPQMRVGWEMAVGVAIGFGAVALLLVQLVVQAQRRKVVTGAQGLLGEAGVALTALALRGTVLIHGERWTAEAPRPIAAGTAVRVRAVHGLRLEVEEALE